MKHLPLVLFFTFITSLNTNAFANQEGNGNRQSLGGVLQTSLNTLAAIRYARIVDVFSYENGLSMNNQGLVNHFRDRFTNNQCLQDLVVEFYNEMRVRDENYPSPSHLAGVPSLAESVGQGRFANLEPGWLWRRAMQYANNNPNLAMELIGICGHDNVEQGELDYTDRSSSALAQREQRIEEIRRELSALSAGDTNRGKLEAELSDLQSQSSGIPSSFRCPEPTSVMFAPGSLGVDIPDALKNRIASRQAPTMGAQSLPSKYYHVLGSAYMACQMVQAGSSADFANWTADTGARVYRNATLCARTRTNVDYRNSLLHYFQAHRRLDEGSLTRGENIYEFLFRISAEERDERGHISCATAVKAGTASERCQILNTFQFREEQSYSNSEIQNLIHRRIDAYNASWLYQNSLNNFCQPGDHSFTAPNAQPPGQSTPVVCLDGFPQAACDSAQQVLHTWEADLEWTAAQHGVGSNFATRHCTPNSRSIESLACEAQSARNSRGGTQPTQPSTQQGVE